MLTVEQLADVDAFLAAAGDFLTDREAEHNLILGICSNIRLGARPPSTEPIEYQVVRSDDRVVLAAIRTPPYNLVLSEVDDGAALAVLAEALVDHDLPGVVGPTGYAGAFAQDWAARAGRTSILSIRERIFRLAVVRPPSNQAPGRLRKGTTADRDLLIDWFDAFVDEALPPGEPRTPPEVIDRRIAAGGVYFWEDGGPVSLTVVGSRTPNGARVGPVYTPPARRGRGYASACVAGASQDQLDQGRTFLFLFTDVANPTSNHIYQEIGYEPIRDIDAWRFGA